MRKKIFSLCILEVKGEIRGRKKKKENLMNLKTFYEKIKKFHIFHKNCIKLFLKIFINKCFFQIKNY